MKKLIFLFLLILIATSCATVPVNADVVLSAEPAGFLYGLLHGIIAPFSFFGSLFFDSIAIYAIDNNGGWYDFGFMLGIGGLTGGSSTINNSK